jgi:chitinase
MIILAYLSDWALTEFPARDAAKLTHMNYSFVTVDDEGKATAAHWSNKDKIRDIIKQFPDLKVGAALGGWGAGGFSEAMETEEKRGVLIESLLEIVEDYGFQGVDLDWEYPCSSAAGIKSAPEDRERFPLFVNHLRKRLNELGEKTGIDYYLTMAVGAGEDCAKNLDFAEMIESLDYVNLMTYDMGCWEASGHHTNLRPHKDPTRTAISAEESVEIYHRHGVPKHKLVIGCAFYGRCLYVTERGERNGLYMPPKPDSERKEGQGRYDALKKRAEEGAEVFWDDEAQAPYLFDPRDNFFASFDNERSIKLKKQFARNEGLGGIMYWEYNSEKTGVYLSAMHEG